MTAPRNQRAQSRRPRRPPKRDTRGLWSPVPRPDPVEPIVPAADPTALIDSLGPPPLRGRNAAAEHYLAAVVERAAALATALAASAGVLAEPGDD